MSERFEDQPWYADWKKTVDRVVTARMVLDSMKPRMPEWEAAERVSSRPCRVPISSGAISEELDRSVGALLCFSCPAKLPASTSRIYCVSHGRPRDHPPVAAWYTGPGGTRNPPGPRLPGKPANPATARDPFAAPVLEVARDARAKVFRLRAHRAAAEEAAFGR